VPIVPVTFWGKRDVNQMLIQRCVNDSRPHGWYLARLPIVTANGEASRGNKWTVPVGGDGGKRGQRPVQTPP
jgi:hypothetical protein